MPINIGSILGAATALFGTPAAVTPALTPTVMTGVSPNGGGVVVAGQGAGGPIDPAAIPIISMILDGMNDSAIRSAARQARVGKTKMIQTLTGLDFASEGQAFTGVQKMFLSNEVEKIFRTKRRPIIPKSLRRNIKQIQFMKKELRFLFPSGK